MFNLKKASGFLIGAALSLFLAHPVHAASYTVVQNDSLYDIGKVFNTSASIIMKNSGLTSDMIYPGQVLNVPAWTYTVKSGDSMYLVAQKYGIYLFSLRKANNKWDNTIYPGQSLTIPKAASNNVSSATASSQSDIDLLARLITAEADDQPYNAKVGVGAVVVNRTKDQRFPSSISAVINQQDGGYYQFTPVENGWIYKPASQDSINAAYDALRGVDPTHGAVYYFDDSATNQWLWSKPIAARIGKMVFTY